MEYPNDTRFAESQENIQQPKEGSTPPAQPPQWAPVPEWNPHQTPNAWFWDPEKAQRKIMRASINKAGMIAVGSTLVMNVVFAVFALIMRDWLVIDKANYEPILYWFQAFLSPVALLVPAIVYLKCSHSEVGKLLKFEKGDLFFKILLVLLGIALAFVANIPGTMLQNILKEMGLKTLNGSSLPSLRTWEVLVPYILSVSVIAPLFEEFVFRGIILSALEEHGQTFAVVVSGILFGMMHGDIAVALVASISGMFFGLIYVKTRNLWVTVAIHSIYNSISLLSGFLPELFKEETASQLNDLLSVVPLILGLLSLILILTVYRKKIFGEKMLKRSKPTMGAFPPVAEPLPAVTKRPESPAKIIGVLITSVPFWVFVAYILLNFVSANYLY